MQISDERLNLVLDKVAKRLNIKRWTYTRSQVDKNIENYFSVLVPVTLVGTVNEEEEVRKSVFIKFAKTNTIDEVKNTIKEIYEVEEYIYCHLFPTYKRISNINIDRFIPECLYADLEPNNEVIVLSDMRSYGFKRYDEDFFDKDRVRSALEALAAFHASSIIFKTKGGDFDNVIMRPFSETYSKAYFHFIKDSIQSHTYLFSGSLYENYLKRLSLDLSKFLLSSTTEVKYLVYGHGDFWRENILFKYKNSKPIQACLVDFQISRKMSAAQDILHLLLTSVEVTDIDLYNEYLNVYLDTFRHVLNENDVNNTYSADDLKHDMKIVAPYVIAITAMSFSLWLGLEIGDILKSKNPGKNYSKNCIIFKNRIINLLEKMNTFGYIQL